MGYFDNANSTQVDERVIEAMLPYFREHYGTAGLELSHTQDVGAVRGLENARQVMATSLNADSRAIVFTSGSTESNNLALRGVVLANKEKGQHIITTSIEVQSILRTCKRLENAGYEVTYLDVDKHGVINLDTLKSAIREDTILVTIQHGNREIGTLQPIDEIANITSEKGVIFHTDATHTFMKVPIDTEKLKADLITIDGHHIHGPKGVGVLYIRRGTRIKRVLEGSDEERRLRPGTENVPAIVGFAKAIEIWKTDDVVYFESLCKHLAEAIEGKLTDYRITGHPVNRIPNIYSIVIEQIEGESILVHLDMEGYSISTGSACSSKTLQGSHVLKSIGLPPEIAHGSVRVSVSRFNTIDEVDGFVEALIPAVERLREFSPLREGVYFAADDDDHDHHHDLPKDDW